MTQLIKNAARAALAAGIGAADTSLTVDITKADLFPAANTGTDPVNTIGKDWFKIVVEDVSHNYEIIYVRTRTLGSAVMSNLLRGQEGTTAISFAAGSVVGLRITAADIENAVQDKTKIEQTFTANQNFISINGGQLAGLRNRIINGDMRVTQRGMSATVLTTAYTYVAADRFAFLQTGTANAVAGVTTNGATGFKQSSYMGRPAGSVTTGDIQATQCIESANVYDLQGKSVTFSFYAKAGANYSGGALSLALYSGTAEDQGLSGGIGGWTGLASPINTTTAITGSWVRYQATGVVPSGCKELAAVLFYTPTGTAGADDFVYFTGVQLEDGSVATPFEHRPYGLELALCQRYLPCYRSTSTSDVLPGAALVLSASTASLILPFPVTPRVRPTGIFAPASTDFSIYAVAGGGASSSTTFTSASLNAARITLTSSSMTPGQISQVLFNSASSYLLFTGCEL